MFSAIGFTLELLKHSKQLEPFMGTINGEWSTRLSRVTLASPIVVKPMFDPSTVITGLPWIWGKNFYEQRMHILDHPPLGPKRWYRRQFKRLQIAAVLQNIDRNVHRSRERKWSGRQRQWFEDSSRKLLGVAAKPFMVTKGRRKALMR
eukprot:GHVT01086872.1.p1 GENE.GHVT01086872.1~~GHVT01086872.1.p1  ORF type:complete len:148 (+),score=5.95 GHVT01086872.1:904-1347(+)